MAKKSSEAFRKAFARKLRGLRLWRDYKSATEFAKAIGEDQNTYTTWERGDALPGLEQAMTICSVLQVDANALLMPAPKSGRMKPELVVNIDESV